MILHQIMPAKDSLSSYFSSCFYISASPCQVSCSFKNRW